MNELIKYLDKLLNIKIDNDFMIEDMRLELSKVKDIVAYRNYIRDQLDSIDYKTGFQKFVILTKMYLEIEEDQMLKITKVYSKADQYAKTVSDKVKECRNFVEDHNIDFKNVKNYFEDHEIRCLKAVGSTSIIIEYSKMNLLEGMINSYYVNSTKKKNKTEQLTDNQKRVMQMVGTVK